MQGLFRKRCLVAGKGLAKMWSYFLLPTKINCTLANELKAQIIILLEENTYLFNFEVGNGFKSIEEVEMSLKKNTVSSEYIKFRNTCKSKNTKSSIKKKP